MRKIYIVILALIAFASCRKDEELHSYTLSGQTVNLYAGQASNKTTLDRNNEPLQMVLSIDAAAMNSLPVSASLPPSMIVMKLPDEVSQLTTIDHISLDWNPAGHDPTGIYNVPHFDVHYYMMSHATVMALMDMSKMNVPPDPAYLPYGYVGGPPVPQMGKHWLDPRSPELNGGPFSQTFIYGSYEGKISFYEPMLSRSWLLSINDFERSIPAPAKVQRSGWYPQILQCTQTGGNVQIILKNFVYRTAG